MLLIWVTSCYFNGNVQADHSCQCLSGYYQDLDFVCQSKLLYFIFLECDEKCLECTLDEKTCTSCDLNQNRKPSESGSECVCKEDFYEIIN